MLNYYDTEKDGLPIHRMHFNRESLADLHTRCSDDQTDQGLLASSIEASIGPRAAVARFDFGFTSLDEPWSSISTDPAIHRLEGW